MTLFFSPNDVEESASVDVAVDAMRQAFKAESEGNAMLPARLNAMSPTGFIRVMPAVLDGVMGLKVMTLVRDRGTRYLVLLYSTETGELLGMFDADELTRIRTAATTLLAAQLMVDELPTRVAVIGSGYEASGHLAALAAAWPVTAACVYSTSPDKREAFADRMSTKLGIDVWACESASEAVASSSTVVLATKSPTPVVDGSDFLPNSLVLSIGSTRPDLRELDETTLRRARALVVDSVSEVVRDSGDVLESLAAGAIGEDRMLSLADLSRLGTCPGPDGSDRDLLVFKSVGTALQDLALARAIYDNAQVTGRGTDVGEISRLKPFT